MYEVLSDSSSSIENECTDLRNNPNKNANKDSDSDSTVIDINLNSDIGRYTYQCTDINDIFDNTVNKDHTLPSTSNSIILKEKPIANIELISEDYENMNKNKCTYIPTVSSTLTRESSLSNIARYKSAKFKYDNVSNRSIDTELESIIKKYSAVPPLDGNTGFLLKLAGSDTCASSNNKDEVIELSSDEDLPQVQKKYYVPPSPVKVTHASGLFNVDIEELSQKYKTISDNTATSSSSHVLKDADSYQSPKKKHKASLNNEEKKMNRAAQREKKHEEAETAKMVKQALLAANKNMKPEECMKFVTVLLDPEIATEKYGGEVLNALQAIEATYLLQTQSVSHTITWNRRIQKHVMDNSEKFIEITEVIETEEVLLIMNWNQVAELVHGQSLLAYVESLKSILSTKKLFLGIYGLQNYFKYYKIQKQRDMRSEITTQASQRNYTKYDKIYKDIPKIGRKQLNLALTELQLLSCVCYRMVDTPQDLGAMIVQFTKAVAQAPFKKLILRLEKYEKQQEAQWYISGDNKDCVRVDKNGNGLQRLWQQQLTTFPLTRLEHAEAITAKFPTPLSLMREYSRSQGKGEKLLQDIPIRRAAGPLSTVRKIGPELSKKIYTFFTSNNGNELL